MTFWWVALLLAGCDGSAMGSEPGDPIDQLFAPATAAEIATVQAEWASRTQPVQGVREEERLTLSLIPGAPTLRVVSHLVGGNRHYGALIVPAGAGAGRLPVVVFNHPGDNGVSTTDIGLVLSLFGNRADDYVFVVPSFRSEPLRVGTRTYRSEGAASPWDHDVDDALALLNVALQTVPQADANRIAALGFSRGGGVSLLMAVRDPRIDLVIDFAGPTDFFDGYVRGVVVEALAGRPPNLPGVISLNERFLQPFAAGDLPVEQLRLELVRRSAVLFAEKLPPTQVHHGVADQIVAVSQAESLIATLGRLQRPAGRDETYLYPGAGHNPLEMPSSVPRTLTFLERLR